MKVVINQNTKIIAEFESEPVNRAITSLARDIKKACLITEKEGANIYVQKREMASECFELSIQENSIYIYAGDELGAIYGIYEISRKGLGIENFWFWNDQKIVPKEEYVMTEEDGYSSKPFKVKYRGWFVNDETLLLGWSVDRSQEKVWEMVFEALLRCGGNMTIPGTDLNSKRYRKTAARMGLWITHHHAEPLGAEMFLRAYPNLKPSYLEQKDKFHKLWKEGVIAQKNCNVIWNLGFRGQGDYPFWEIDPQFNTMESRGELMSKIIKEQYDIVKGEVPDAVCCTNLYGETMELYREGHLKLPDDVIKIWADNGFGKMVTRRQGNHNPRIPALPDSKDTGRHGIYYHVSFYDLQAANHITMLPSSPEFVARELEEVFAHYGDQYWLINSSSVKPHVYFLDLISKLWKDGTADVEKHRNDYIADYYGLENVKSIAQCFKKYPEYAIAYGEHEDDHAGEQFANHVIRILVSQFMRDDSSRAKELLWATEAETLKEQILWYQKLCKKASEGYKEYRNLCEKVAIELKEEKKSLFEDSLLLQVKIYEHSFTGAFYGCKGMLLAMDKRYQEAFYEIGKAKEEFVKGNEAMRAREHGKWHNFYENECQVDVKQTAWVLGGLMAYIRNLGDGPHFYQWQREFQDTKENQRIMLLLNTTNHLQDEELFALMKEALEK
ncbi:MAG: glycosyl hydrolase 115 family protein [bacterium]|nr:glycosyl hydrolase 115 family protein [bacterium]